MPNCDFYALAPDLVEVLEFVFAQPGWKLIELASEPEHPLREFHATRDVVGAFPRFEALARPIHLQLYCEKMRGSVRARRIDFNPGAVPGGAYRYDSEGWGLIQLYFGMLRRSRVLTSSHTNHNSEARASRWEPIHTDLGAVADWDWAEVSRVSGRLTRFIRKLSVRKIGSRPVLKAAADAAANGALDFAP